MRVSTVAVLAASAAVLPAMSMPISSSETYELYDREAPSQGSGALGFGLIKDVFKVGSHLFHHSSSSNNNNNNNNNDKKQKKQKKQKHRRELEELLSRREFLDLLAREIEVEEMYAREAPAQGSGALGFGLLKDVFKVGSHILSHSSSSNNNQGNKKNQKHRRSDEFEDLFARDYEYTYEWE
ncbi:uncharacterized protein C8Q71DRAFT_855662 [Rhodofomes roseus]|uniref:Uncharacterized protein n=1 Tax=Rhodofomes roseus TaxID=34475 RepID=A0ABQ8KL20_9APHY|nr:uncharacterized protein C8Q71DRAFT_855662 [Rhodofomes roseus]KAH9839009.1 hypothetical protein C8Q71DRAFT_855662 [Rhodofomes roseus]